MPYCTSMLVIRSLGIYLVTFLRSSCNSSSLQVIVSKFNYFLFCMKHGEKGVCVDKPEFIWMPIALTKGISNDYLLYLKIAKLSITNILFCMQLMSIAQDITLPTHIFSPTPILYLFTLINPLLHFSINSVYLQFSTCFI